MATQKRISRNNELSVIFKNAWAFAKQDGKNTLKGGSYLKKAWAIHKAKKQNPVENNTPEINLFDFIKEKEYNDFIRVMKAKYNSYYDSVFELEDFIFNTQEKLIKRLSKFDPSKGKFVTWASTVFKNANTDQFRTKKKVQIQSLYKNLNEKEEILFEDNSEKLKQYAIGKESLLNSIKNAVDLIKNEKHKESLKMLYYENLSYEEIGNRLSVSVEVARVYVNRGKNDLKKLVKI